MEFCDRLERETQAVGNADMHQEIMASIVLRLSPILADIVRQGIKEIVEIAAAKKNSNVESF